MKSSLKYLCYLVLMLFHRKWKERLIKMFHTVCDVLCFCGDEQQEMQRAALYSDPLANHCRDAGTYFAVCIVWMHKSYFRIEIFFGILSDLRNIDWWMFDFREFCFGKCFRDPPWAELFGILFGDLLILGNAFLAWDLLGTLERCFFASEWTSEIVAGFSWKLELSGC